MNWEFACFEEWERGKCGRFKHGLTTGPPRSSWAETQANAMARAAMLMIDFMVCIYLLIDQIWELWGLCGRIFGKTRRPNEQNADPKAKAADDILYPAERRSFASILVVHNYWCGKSSWRGGPGSWNMRTRRLICRRQKEGKPPELEWSLFGSQYPNPRKDLFLWHPSHNILPLQFNLNRCRP